MTRLESPGTRAERWVLHRDDPERRCAWPSADVARRAAVTAPHGARSIISAYIHLISHPAGTEVAVRKLRAIRRAERERVRAGAAMSEVHERALSVRPVCGRVQFVIEDDGILLEYLLAPDEAERFLQAIPSVIAEAKRQAAGLPEDD